MDNMLDEELLRLWKCLGQYNVNYIMVGDFATYFHGFGHPKDALDIWLEDTLDNRKKLRAAFKALGYGDMKSIETMQFVPGWTSFYVGSVIELDIMTSMKGLENMTFTECLEQASIVDIDGITIPFLHINQLIQNKKVVNRPKDQIDVMELEKIRKIRDGK